MIKNVEVFDHQMDVSGEAPSIRSHLLKMLEQYAHMGCGDD